MSGVGGKSHLLNSTLVWPTSSIVRRRSVLPLTLPLLGLAAASSGVPLALALVNPRIVAASDETCSLEEGCLSFPDIRGSVERPWSVVIEHLGLDGRVRQTRLNGFFARAAQHEIDHLAGDLFIDRFSHVKKLAIRTKLKRLQAETREKLETA